MMSVTLYLKSGKHLDAIVEQLNTSEYFIECYDEDTKTGLVVPISSLEFLECQDLEEQESV